MIGLLAALALAVSAHEEPRAGAVEPPKLLVVIVVDQMRAETLDRFGPEFKGGLARLSKHGFIFTQARHTHVPLETGPGHAVIMTGQLPSEMGIVGNDWWDPARRAVIFSVEDPLWGRGPAQLTAYTLGEALTAKDPGSRVVCLSVKDRSAILMCGKRPDAVVWYDKDSGRLATSGYYGALPGWAETAALKPASTGYYSEFRYQPASDRLIEETAEKAIEWLRLGQGKAPDLLALSFSATDYVGHRYGPDGPEMRAQILAVDAVIGRLLAALDRLAVPYAVVLTSDHGAGRSPANPEWRERGAALVGIDTLRDAAESALRSRFPLGAGEGPWVTHAGTSSLALDRRLAASKGVRFDRLQAAALKAVRRVPGVATAYSQDELEDGAVAGKPFAELFAHSYYPGRSGHILFALKEDAELDYRDGHAAFHGQPHDLDARVPLIFFGAGVRAGRSDRAVPMTSLAPTAARLVGVPFPGAEALGELFPAAAH